MDRTLSPPEWKPQRRRGKLPALLSKQLHQMPAEVLQTVSFNRCLSSAAEHSGLEDAQIADKIHISRGYMSKFMRAVAQQWAKRLVAYMNHTQSIAPLQWIAAQMGCEVVLRSSLETELAKTRARLQQLEREGRGGA